MSFFPVIGIIAMVLIGLGVLAAVIGDYTSSAVCAGLATSILILGAFFMLVDIHAVITEEKEEPDGPGEDVKEEDVNWMIK